MERPAFLLSMQILFLASIAVGGFISTMPELHRFVVDVHRWMSDDTFVALFALVQAAPGPNMMVVTLLGWEVGGLGGAALATLAACLPTLAFAYGAQRFWLRFNDLNWYRTFERGIAPFSVGLVLATGVIFVRAAGGGEANPWIAYLMSAATVAFLLFTKRSPLLPLGIAAVLGLAGFA